MKKNKKSTWKYSTYPMSHHEENQTKKGIDDYISKKNKKGFKFISSILNTKK